MANPAYDFRTLLGRYLTRAASGVALLGALTLLAGQSIQAQTFSVIHAFTGGGDGGYPLAGLTMDARGNLYGTTFDGGGSEQGVVFRLTKHGTDWILNPLYSFAGGNDGAYPSGRVGLAGDGTLYGTTSSGGGGCPGGCGTVFHLSPSPSAPRSALAPWSETVVYRFRGIGYSGSNPQGDVIFDQLGNIYGTAEQGGNNDGGLVYELVASQDWAESVLYVPGGGFSGQNPYGGVVFDGAGNLYGTNSTGSEGAEGAVYRLSPSGSSYSEQTLQVFSGPNGATPKAGLIFDQSGNLYGTTTGGAENYGTVFELTYANGAWIFNTIYSFASGTVGGGPEDKLSMDAAGNLYGTTYADGMYGYGSVFKLTNSNGSWTYTSLHDFGGGSDGGHPVSTIIFDVDGNLYGTASVAGMNNNGVVFEIVP